MNDLAARGFVIDWQRQWWLDLRHNARLYESQRAWDRRRADERADRRAHREVTDPLAAPFAHRDHATVRAHLSAPLALP